MGHRGRLSVENELIVQYGYLSLEGFSMECTRRIWCHILEVTPLKARVLSGHLLHTAQVLWFLSSFVRLKYFQMSEFDLDGT